MTTTAPNVITTAVALIAASLAAVVGLLIWHPELFLWIVAACALCALLGVGIVACDFRAERNEAVAESERLERELEARAPGVTMVPRVTFVAPETPEAPLLTELMKPDLRIVPPQRDGGHDRLPVADGEFPVHTAVDEDELTALVRATEEN